MTECTIFAKGQVVCGTTTGSFYIVVGRKRANDGYGMAEIVVVRPVDGDARMEFPAISLRAACEEYQIPDGYYHPRAFLVASKLNSSQRKQFISFVYDHLSERRLQRPYGAFYTGADLQQALNQYAQNRARKRPKRGESVSAGSDPHYSLPRFCVVCGGEKSLGRNRAAVPVHRQCAQRNMNSMSVRYCAYCRVRYTQNDLRAAGITTLIGWRYRFSCPEGQVKREQRIIGGLRHSSG